MAGVKEKKKRKEKNNRRGRLFFLLPDTQGIFFSQAALMPLFFLIVAPPFNSIVPSLFIAKPKAYLRGFNNITFIISSQVNLYSFVYCIMKAFSFLRDLGSKKYK